MGTSLVAIILEKSSAMGKNAPPSKMEAGMLRRQSLPMRERARCGTTSPTHPIIPLTETQAAVTKVAQTMAVQRTRCT